MHVHGVGLSDVGRKRAHNEDFLLLRPDLGLYLVADGMGGHAAGEVASRLAGEVIVRHLEERRGELERVGDSEAARDALLTLVREAIEAASREVYRVATSESGRGGMGTTVTLMLTIGDKGIMGHVGDSRLYLLRQRKLHQLSEDHSYTAELVRRGHLTKEEAERSPYANVITRAVGIQESVQVDTLLFDILPGDTYMLCSDGLCHYFEDEELGELLAGEDLDEITRRLVGGANERGGRDNISVLVTRAAQEKGDAAEERRSTEVNLRVDTLRHMPLFRYLTMKELLSVMEILRVETCDEGELILREGESSDSLYVVLSGGLEVTKSGGHVADLSPGNHFGEMALLNQRPRTATVRARKPSRLLVMDRSAFNDLVRREPTLGVKFLWTFAQVLSLRLDEATLGRQADPETIESPPFE